MQHSVINCSHFAVHEIPRTYKILTFGMQNSRYPSTSWESLQKGQISAALQLTGSFRTSLSWGVEQSTSVMSLAGFEMERLGGAEVWGRAGLPSAWPVLFREGADDGSGRLPQSPHFFFGASKPTSDGLDYRVCYLKKWGVPSKKRTIIFIHPELNDQGAWWLGITWLLERWPPENPVCSP